MMSFKEVFAFVLIVLMVHGDPKLSEPEPSSTQRNVELDDDCTQSGCHKGYCWAYCRGGLWKNAGEWCYTSTKPYTQSDWFVRCEHDSECDGCWKCAGACSL